MEYTLISKETGRVLARLRLNDATQLEQYLSPGVKALKGGHAAMERASAEEEELALRRLRAERDALLNQHGWTVANHSPLSEESKAEWMVYLQTLHEITLQPASARQFPTTPELRFAPSPFEVARPSPTTGDPDDK